MTSPWSAPGATAPQPTRTSPDASAGSEPTLASTSDERGPLPPPPVPLRPMTVPDLLDGAFAIVKRRPRDVLLLAAAFVVPVELLSAFLLRDLLDQNALSGDGAFTVDDSGEFTGLGSALASAGFGAISLALLAGALALVVDAWFRDEDLRPGQAILATLRRSPALVLGVVLVKLLEGLGVIAVLVGAYVMMALLHVVSPAITVEGIGAFKAIGRSMQLCTRRFWASMNVPALVGVIGLLVSFGFQLLPELAVLAVPDGWDWLIRAAGVLLTQLIVTPFTAGVAVLYHLDLRIRTEGLDIERRGRALFDA